MLYYLFLRDYSAAEYAESIGQSDRNIRGIRETTLKRIRKLYDRQKCGMTGRLPRNIYFLSPAVGAYTPHHGPLPHGGHFIRDQRDTSIA